MSRTILSIIIFGYGITITYRKSRTEHNPKKLSYKSDGSIRKYKFNYSINEFSDWQFVFRWNYNHRLIFRINLNR